MKIYIEAINDVMETNFTQEDLNTMLSDVEEWDSLSGLGLMALGDEEFNVVITPSTLENAKTVNDLVLALQGKTK